MSAATSTFAAASAIERLAPAFASAAAASCVNSSIDNFAIDCPSVTAGCTRSRAKCYCERSVVFPEHRKLVVTELRVARGQRQTFDLRLGD